MNRSLLLLVTTLGCSAVACGDDSGTGGTGGTGGGDASTTGASTTTAGTTTTTAATTGAVTSTTTSTTGPGGGGGGSGGAGGGTGGGGTGGGSDCPDILVGDVSEDVCALAPGSASPAADMAVCADLETTWPAQIFAIDVEAGDCLYMHADNVGSLGAETFGAIVDPLGNNVLLDDEIACAVENPSGYQCAEGALTMAASGVAYLFAGAFADEACPAGEETAYQLFASLNGVDVDLSAGPVCRGDLLQIVP